jgi:hypothetical protein
MGKVKKEMEDLIGDSMFVDQDSKAGLQENRLTTSASQ